MSISVSIQDQSHTENKNTNQYTSQYTSQCCNYHPIRSKFNMELTKKEIIDMRAILSSSWVLNETQRQACAGMYFLKKSNVKTLLSKINTDHPYIDNISIKTMTFRVFYINGSTSYLQDLIDKNEGDIPVLCSFRGSQKYCTYSCLVVINPRNMEMYTEKTPELE